MFKGYHQTSEKSIVDDLMNLKKYPGNGFLDGIDPNRLHHLIQDALHGGCLDIGIGIMSMFLENETNSLCGARYDHLEDRKYYRYGKQSGFIYAGGQRVPIKKPRVIAKEGGEATLKTYQTMQDPSRFHESVLRHMILGVSTRKYDQVIEHAAERLSIKKSAISDAFKAMTKKKLKEFGERNLEHEDILVIFLDGTPVSGEMMLAALGINISGKKMVLGVRQGNTENTQVVEDLLKDIKDRGLNSRNGLLFVVDGGKALSKAIRKVFGEQVYIQRCRVHKKRNVLSYLSEEKKLTIGRALDVAYAETDHSRAIAQLQKIAENLEEINPDASASMLEGLEETCTILQFSLHKQLFRTLMSTNPLESMFSITGDTMKRVKRWKGNDMRKRWMVASVLEAEKRLRCIRGCKYLPDLKKAMQEDQEKRFGKLDESKEVA